MKGKSLSFPLSPPCLHYVLFVKLAFLLRRKELIPWKIFLLRVASLNDPFCKTLRFVDSACISRRSTCNMSNSIDSLQDGVIGWTVTFNITAPLKKSLQGVEPETNGTSVIPLANISPDWGKTAWESGLWLNTDASNHYPAVKSWTWRIWVWYF